MVSDKPGVAGEKRAERETFDRRQRIGSSPEVPNTWFCHLLGLQNKGIKHRMGIALPEYNS